jgi:hypothetical protein
VDLKHAPLLSRRLSQTHPQQVLNQTATEIAARKMVCVPLQLLVHPGFAAQDLRSLIELAKKAPGKISYGMAGRPWPRSRGRQARTVRGTPRIRGAPLVAVYPRAQHQARLTSRGDSRVTATAPLETPEGARRRRGEIPIFGDACALLTHALRVEAAARHPQILRSEA